MKPVLSAKPLFGPEQRPKKPARKRAPAKKPLFAHVRHTGRVLSQRHTSFPLIVFLLIMVGVVMCLNSALVNADIFTSSSYVVHGRVPGIPPASPAVITSPVDGTIFSESLIPVSGTCPENAFYVKLYRNNIFVGAALCHEGTFTLEAELIEGKNVLQTKDFNGADLEGPDSKTLTVYYQSTVGASSSVNSGNFGGPPPLSISSDFSYNGYYINQQLTWTISIAGGAGPFITHVDWGDGNDSIQEQDNDGPANITHTYTRHTNGQVPYTIKITVTDGDGQAAFMQLATLIDVPGITGATFVTGNTTPSGPGLPSLESTILHIAKYAWPTYIFTVVMVLSFWLGENREFVMLHGRFRFVKRLRRLS